MFLRADDVELTVKRLSELTGYTEKAIRAKIERGVWAQGEVWRYAPDGRVIVNLGGFNRWVAGQVSGSSGAVHTDAEFGRKTKELQSQDS